MYHNIAQGTQGIFHMCVNYFANCEPHNISTILRNHFICSYAIFNVYYYYNIVPFYHIRSNERAKYDALLNCKTGKNIAGKRSNKMARLSDPNFDQ